MTIKKTSKKILQYSIFLGIFIIKVFLYCRFFVKFIYFFFMFLFFNFYVIF